MGAWGQARHLSQGPRYKNGPNYLVVVKAATGRHLAVAGVAGAKLAGEQQVYCPPNES